MTADLGPAPTIIDSNVRFRFESPSGPVSHTAQELFEIYNERLDRIETQVMDIRETMVRTEEMVQKFIAAVRPVVDDLIPTVVALSEHPMLRTFLGGKKKNK